MISSQGRTREDYTPELPLKKRLTITKGFVFVVSIIIILSWGQFKRFVLDPEI